MLKETFTSLLERYTDDAELMAQLWTEIAKAYSPNTRHYHTLSHLSSLLARLTSVRQDIDNWDAVLFALYYHDVVYNALRSDNEAQSAQLAEERMSALQVPSETRIL